MTVVGRVNLVNRTGLQLIKPYVITAPYFNGDKGYSNDLIQQVNGDLGKIHGDVRSHSVRDMMVNLYLKSEATNLIKFEGQWGDNSNWITLGLAATEGAYTVAMGARRCITYPLWGIASNINHLVFAGGEDTQQKDEQFREQYKKLAKEAAEQAKSNSETRARKKAAITIQSAFRGSRARKQVQELRQFREQYKKLAKEAAEQAKSNSETREKAAITIQSAFRGGIGLEKQVQKLLERRHDSNVQAALDFMRQQSENEAAEQAKSNSETRARVKAAITIQSAFRGSRARKQVQALMRKSQQQAAIRIQTALIGLITSVAVGLGLGFGVPSFVFAGHASAALFTVGSLTITAGLLSIVGVTVLSGLVVAVAYRALVSWNRQQMRADDRTHRLYSVTNLKIHLVIRGKTITNTVLQATKRVYTKTVQKGFFQV